MARDHFVSQVHLRQFVSPELGNRMFAIRKDDMLEFTPEPKDVCRIEEGSTNEYLSQTRAVEDFLHLVEPKYNEAIRSIECGELSHEAITCVAGFVAYVYSCSPTGMRLASEPLRAETEVTAEILERQGELPPIPEALGVSSLAELIATGGMQVDIDPKYPQAVGISQIGNMTIQLGNFRWEFLRNREAGSPFFTSDFPIGLEPWPDRMILNKVVPLTPSLAVRIVPDPELDPSDLDASFKHLRCRTRNARPKEVSQINRLLVRSAENLVFYRNDLAWVRRFVERNRHYRVECLMDRIRTGSGHYLISNQGVAAYVR